MDISSRWIPRRTGWAAAAALTAWLAVGGPTTAGAQESGNGFGSSPPTSVAGDVFFGSEQVARARADIHGRSLVEAAARRNREAAARDDRERRVRRPDPDGDRRVRRPPLLHPVVPRMVIVRPPDHEGPGDTREDAPVRRARRSPDVPLRRIRETPQAGPGAPTATSGRIGRHLRDAGSAAPGAADATARCAAVQIRTRSGIGFGIRVDAGALGAASPDEVARILRRTIDQADEPLVLPGVDGRTMRLPPGDVTGLLVGPCR